MQLKFILVLVYAQILVTCGMKSDTDKYEGDGLRDVVEQIPFVKLANFTDYVDNTVTFFHSKAQWKMKFTSEWSDVTENRSLPDRDGLIFYTYFPKIFTSGKFKMEHDPALLSELERRYALWDMAAQLGPNFLPFAKQCGRLFSVFKGMKIEQLSFAHIHFTTTFILDDPYEGSCRLGVSESFGAIYIENLRMIINGVGIPVNLEKMEVPPFIDSDERREKLKKILGEAAIAQDALTSTIVIARRVLSPPHFELHQKFLHTWLTYLIKEAPVFQHNASRREYPTYETLYNTRKYTVGFELVLAGVIPAGDAHLQYFNYDHHESGNPHTLDGSLVVAIDNDIVGIPKETKPGEFSPSNFAMTLKAKEEVPTPEGIRVGVKAALEKRNDILKKMEDRIKGMEEGTEREAYMVLLMYTVSIGEFEYIVGEGFANTRYKWACANDK